MDMIYITKMYIMRCLMQVSKWGNSLAVRLPAKLVEQLGLKEGDEVEIRATTAKATVEIERRPSRDELMDRLDSLRGTMPKGYKFDRDEANERGGYDKD
jgi:antitoxin MazE